jgi:hypothetical protein
MTPGQMTRWLDSGEAGVDVHTLRLEPGSHRSPRDGVCLLELTSLLAGEKFSDRPRCVCEVIAAFLRGWNDRSSHAERQRLRPYAVRVIHSRAGRSVTNRRRDICLMWAGADLSGNALTRVLRRLAMRFRILVLCGIGPALRLDEGAGELAARVVFARHDSRAGLRLVDTLLAVGSEDAPKAPSAGAEEGDALARAVVERALRDRVPHLADPDEIGGNGNGNGNGDRGAAPAGAAARLEE